MNDEFATAMRRSLDLTRAGDLGAATQQIQAALQKRSGQSTAAPKASHARRPLGATVDGLDKQFGGFRKRAPFAQASTPTAAPTGARFERKCFQGPEGARDYWLYTPSCAEADLRGLVVMLHGCTQSPVDFATGTGMNEQGEDHKMMVAYPVQTQTHNANKCWNWFAPEHQRGGLGEPAVLSELARSIAAEHDLPAGHTFVAGLSAGGAMAAILGSERPDVFRGVGVHSGLAPGSARDVMGAFSAMRGDHATPGVALSGPAIVFHGLSDTTVAPVNASRVVGTIETPIRHAENQNGRRCQRTTGQTAEGHPIELWLIEGGGHAWSGGSPSGSFTEAAGPDASAEMMRFFNTLMETPI